MRAIDPQPGDRLVEVGPGRGAITVAAAAAGGHARRDRNRSRRDPDARRRIAAVAGTLRLHVADALEFDLRELRGAGPKLRLVGNLPYNVSTPLLFRFIAQLDAIDDMHFMLQKEVVARMAAAPGSGDYGRLTVMLAPSVGGRVAVRHRCRRIQAAAASHVDVLRIASASRRRRSRSKIRQAMHASCWPHFRNDARPCAIRWRACWTPPQSRPPASIRAPGRKRWRRTNSLP